MTGRFLEEVRKEHLKHPEVETIIGQRGTEGSAGYDLRIKEDITLAPNEFYLAFTDQKVYMANDEMFKVIMRSSAPLGLVLKNGTGLIDSDYYGNPKNDGNIGLPLWNIGKRTIHLKAGERICQGTFEKYLIVNDDVPVNKDRVGGMGSTGKN